MSWAFGLDWCCRKLWTTSPYTDLPSFLLLLGDIQPASQILTPLLNPNVDPDGNLHASRRRILRIITHDDDDDDDGNIDRTKPSS